jgi:hypothetical protein
MFWTKVPGSTRPCQTRHSLTDLTRVRKMKRVRQEGGVRVSF